MQELLNDSQLIDLFCIVITFFEVGHGNGFSPQVMCNREQPLITKTKEANHARERSWILSSIGLRPAAGLISCDRREAVSDRPAEHHCLGPSV